MKKQKLPKISLITPSYNQGKFIKDTIESVLTQGYPNLEYIVVDGGSTDETVSILKKYGSALKWVSEPDNGQTDAINKGLRLSTGDILGYLNSDDILMPGSLMAVAECYRQGSVDWITGDCIVIDPVGKPSPGGWLVRGYKRLLMALYSPTTLKIADNMIPQPSTFWSRRAYRRIGEFDKTLNYVMDYDYWLRLSKHYRPHDLPIVISGFRAQPESKSETSRDKLMAEGNLVLIKHGASRLELILHKIHCDVVRFVYNLLKK